MGTPKKPSTEELNLAATSWRKAARSDNQGACVRVALHAGHVLFDDSKNPAPASRNALVFTPGEFTALLNTLRV